jgi:hypothetical protein
LILPQTFVITPILLAQRLISTGLNIGAIGTIILVTNEDCVNDKGPASTVEVALEDSYTHRATFSFAIVILKLYILQQEHSLCRSKTKAVRYAQEKFDEQPPADFRVRVQ